MGTGQEVEVGMEQEAEVGTEQEAGTESGQAGNLHHRLIQRTMT